MMQDPITDRLAVEGADLYYERRGAGPLLLLIAGGPADADVFAAVASVLAERFTVVAYDPRGNSRSRPHGAPVELTMDTLADDAARLLSALDAGPALVFGTSGGAQVGLHLAAREPARVHTLVAHEPPCVALLADGEQVAERFRAVVRTHASNGAGPAMQIFAGVAGLPQAPPGTNDSMVANADFFLAHGLLPIARFVPDVPALKASAVNVVVAVGDASRGQLAHRCGLALAERLGVMAVHLPGGHAGYREHPDAFAQALAGALLTARLVPHPPST